MQHSTALHSKGMHLELTVWLYLLSLSKIATVCDEGQGRGTPQPPPSVYYSRWYNISRVQVRPFCSNAMIPPQEASDSGVHLTRNRCAAVLCKSQTSKRPPHTQLTSHSPPSAVLQPYSPRMHVFVFVLLYYSSVNQDRSSFWLTCMVEGFVSVWYGGVVVCRYKTAFCFYSKFMIRCWFQPMLALPASHPMCTHHTAGIN